MSRHAASKGYLAYFDCPECPTVIGFDLDALTRENPVLSMFDLTPGLDSLWPLFDAAETAVEQHEAKAHNLSI